MKLSIKPSRVAKALGGAICALASFSLIGQYSSHFLGHGRLLGFVHQFDLNAEANISTYFATVLLLGASLLLGVIARQKWQKEGPFRLHWVALALIFAYLSVDELAQIHESVGHPTYKLLKAGGLPVSEQILYIAWVIPAVVVLAVFGFAFSRFFWHLSPRWKLLFAASGIIYVTGAVGMEIPGELYASELENPTFTYELIVTAEEVLEMAGTSVFIYTLLEYLRAEKVELQVSIEKTSVEEDQAVIPA